jgi:hypothetical protein
VLAGGRWQLEDGRWVVRAHPCGGGRAVAVAVACLLVFGVVRAQAAPIVPIVPTWGLRMVSVLSSLLGTRTNCFSGLANGCPWMPYLSPAPGVAWSQVGHVIVDG